MLDQRHIGLVPQFSLGETPPLNPKASWISGAPFWGEEHDGPLWGSGAHVSDAYGRLVNDGLWHLPIAPSSSTQNGNVREGVARERDVPASFTPEGLAAFEREQS
jgi:hypothetical protein